MCYQSFKPGRFGQWIAAITASFCSMTTGQVLAWPASALPLIISGEAGFTLSAEEQSWMVTMTFIGNIVSPVPIGYVMDKIGRKTTLFYSLLMVIASWVLIFFCKTALGLYAARFLAGLWSGVMYTVIPVFIGEVADPSIRGGMGGMFGVNLYLGALFQSLAGTGSYDLLTILSSLPPTILFIAFLFLPESPYFYLMKGQKDKARQSIIWLTGHCSDQKLDNIENAVKEQLSRKGTFADIFKTGASKKAFIIVEVLGIMQRLAGVTLLFAFVSILLPETFLTGSQSFILLCVVWTAVAFVSSFFMDKYGRRGMMITSCVGSGIAMLAVTIWYYLEDQTNVDTTGTEWLPLFLLVINGIFYSFGIVSIPQLIQGEVFSVNIKAKASAIACITQSVASGITTYLYLPLTDYVGVYSNFLLCFISSILGAVFTYAYVVETIGKTLEQIQDDLELSGRKNPTPKTNEIHE